MKNLFTLLLTIFSFLTFATAQEAEKPPENTVEQLDKYNQLNPTEKAYIHLNKDLFSAGETIWFKSLCG